MSSSQTLAAGGAILLAAVLSTMIAPQALAHPHPGGIVVRDDGSVLVGDILASRLLVIEPSGQWRAIRGVLGVRDLEQAADGTVYGVSQSQGLGLWKLGAKEQPDPLLSDFHGLFKTTTLLVIDDQLHSHMMPWDRPLHWLIGAVTVGGVSLLGVAVLVRRYSRRRKSK